ncbi:glycosyltransferase 61 family protein [Actibacterium lipolyticum]|uniref:Glycosyltransferase 61 catalytic domain-containing protein n=1 Tax=Actibacterium lipolyticum TaxID=1524263 RepID=A0A238KX85_9RHOB|nr:glycosyltransferase 61 family protein [Actibacterium lipolyticum]SMX47181.1 hypothetical protein COL8621_03361 [Actibacterium lipolyticum]
MSNESATIPNPDGGWSTEIVTIRDAIVMPPEISKMRQPAGVLHRDGSYCAHAALWRGKKPITLEPSMPTGPLPRLEGRWLWGGLLWAHFGHFLAESTARLWALDYEGGKFDGVLFIPKRPRLGEQIQPFHRDYLDMMGCNLPIRVMAEPGEVEELIVPGQGFGLGEISAGTEAYRASIHKRFGADVPADGPDRLYVSRSELGLGKGGLLGEVTLEEKLAEQGYEIFHPQKHDMKTQVARYKAAKQIIAGDGSALHLFAMVGRPDQQVAVVLRRSSNVVDNLINHLTHFCEREPIVLDALAREWVPQFKQRSSRLSFGELHLPRLQRKLVRSGFIERREPWRPLSDEDRNAIFAEKGLTGDRAFVEGTAIVKRNKK